MSVSSSTFYRKVKKYTDCSPTEYIKKFQLQKAAKLLLANFGNVSEVAYEVGFNNLSYFAKCFKEVYGVTPGEYLKKKKPKNRFDVRTTSFVGRQEELSEIKDILNRHRLVTLRGPGGAGKTRIAMEVADEVKDNFRDGAKVVRLASIADPKLVPSTILRTFNLSERPNQTPIEVLADHLQDRELLLVMDNFEHVTSAATKINILLQQCPKLTILITSREILHLSGEYQYPISPLPVPKIPDEVTHNTLGHLKEYTSVQLFLERAAMVSSGFQINNENAVDIVTICGYLDGLPLAIELAASQIKIFSPSELSKELDKNLSMLKSLDHDRPERHQTLWGAISWSYTLLSDNEQNLFQSLSLFNGSFNLKAAEAIGEESATLGTLDGLRSLLDKNFLQTTELMGETRFKMLETLKSYGREALRESRKERVIIRKMADHFLQIAQKAATRIKGGRQKYWIGRLGMELDNIRGVLSLLEQHREVELGLQLGTALWRYWVSQNLMDEGYEQLKKLVRLADHLKLNEGSRKTELLKGRALSAMGIMGMMVSKDYKKNEDNFRQCIRTFRKIDHKKELAESLNHYGWIKLTAGEYREGTMYTREALELHKRLNDIRGIAVSHNNFGWMEYIHGNLSKAESRFTESISLREDIGDYRGSAFVSSYLALVDRCLGKYDVGLDRLRQAREVLEELEDLQLISMVNTSQGYIFYDTEEFQKAERTLKSAIDGWKEVGNPFGLIWAHDLLGLSYLPLDKPGLSKKCFDWAHDYYEQKYKDQHLNQWLSAFPLYCLAEYNAHIGNISAALDQHLDILSRRIKQEEKVYICESLEACARLFARQENCQKAVIYLASATQLRNKIHAPRPPRSVDSCNKTLDLCKKIIPDQAYREQWKQGETYSLDKLRSIF
ncbi:helix-turn-helix domain-containing protein [Fodinibius salsisoli]|uniref:helix-turn-helix domain-containing protein n=1 Tax=Fodinibius salsisoli TaxID=2820877 RepID=UPI003D9CA0D2